METSRDDFVIAIRSAFLKKGTKQRFSILGLIFFSIIILILGSFDFKAIGYVKKIINEIVYRSSFIVSVPENLLKKNYQFIQDHFSLYEKNQKSKLELKNLKSKDLSNEILILENTKYKKLIDDYFIEDNETFAKVLIDKQSPFLRSVIINKGSKNNIKLGMIVLEENYLVGKIVEVNYFSSRVLLISDINSKIPVSLQPGDTQAIMSGNGKNSGVLQYVKETSLKENKDLLVLTSGAGGVFKSGIPVGKILIKQDTLNGEKRVNFYKDFSQLKYVKIVSYSKEIESLDSLSKEDSKLVEDEIQVSNQKAEALRVLLEQKKIAEEIREKIENENIFLKNKIIQLKNEILDSKNIINENQIRNKDIKFLELNLLYGHKCRKNFFSSNLFKVGTEEYKNCVLNKGPKKN